MAGLSDAYTLLCKHKNSLIRELNSTNILSELVKNQVFTAAEENLVLSEDDDDVKCDIFIRLLSEKSVDIIREFCYALDNECTHVVKLNDLTSDSPEANEEMGETLRHIDSDKESEESCDRLRDSFPPPPPPCATTFHSVTPPSPNFDAPPPPLPPLTNGGQPVEMFQEPVEEQGGERIVWEFHQVTLNRVPGYGFGIAVSGGRDNPHFTNGDPAIAISDVLKAGPAEGKLLVNDRIMSANGVSLENVEYATAVQVLRDSGNTVTLVVRRRVVLPTSPEPQTLRIQLTKSRKKDDFGLILGSKIYVREVGVKLDGPNSLQEGDVLLKINSHATEGMSLKEARKLIESSKEKLNLTVKREAPRSLYSSESTALQTKGEGNYLDVLNGNYSSQNLYVSPPTRQQLDDKSNLLPRRSRNPLLDASMSQLDRPASPSAHHNHSLDNMNSLTNHNSLSRENISHGSHSHSHSHSRSRSTLEEPPDPPRPPPPKPEGIRYKRRFNYYSSRAQLYEEDPLSQRSKQPVYVLPVPDPRFITFQKEGSVGIRLTGGNEVGIFVTAVQPGSPASLQGLQPGDKILKVNDMDMKNVTREEAVLFLLSLQDQVHLIVQHRREEYEHIVAGQRGDSFHIKAHFNYDQPNKGEMSFRKGDIFHVVDTLHNGVVGSWQVFRIGRNNQEVQKGIIPNKARAEELATAQFNASKKELNTPENRGSFFRRRRHSHRRSKSLCKDHWDDVVFGDSVSKFPAYERVVLRHPGFIRPVVLFGPVSDMARDKLLLDFPDKFSSPQLENTLEDGKKSSGIIRLSAIRDIMDRGKHALLDITPNAVDRLNYAQFYPIVIFLRAETKTIIKELRAGLSKTHHKSSRKLFDQCRKLEKIWSHVFNGTVTLTGPDVWYRKLRELINKHQSGPVWMSESKPEETLSDDFLFPMASLRLSYASSPESDVEQNSSGVLLPPRLVKCSSDPSIATQEDTAVITPSYNAPPPYTPSAFKQASYEPTKPRRSGGGDKYSFSPPQSPLTGGVPPELPPRIDRSNKPPRSGGNPGSAAERLFGSNNAIINKNDDPPNYINATPQYRPQNSSLERQHANKTTSSYDSVSSYDSYGQRIGPPNGNLGPNAHDDLKSCNGDARTPPRSAHDPYRFTRSTQQPIKANGINGVNGVGPPLDVPHKPNKPTDYPKYRPPGGGHPGGIVEYATSKPLPPPKAPQSYKPIPPPKPKNYRPPASQQYQTYQTATVKETAPYQHAKSYSIAENNYGSHLTNGVPPSPGKYSSDTNDNGGFDSGHGSSLDRTYDHRSDNRSMDHHRSPSQYYYNVSRRHNHHHREPSGLDLTHRDQRGSAFELYKKPSDPRNNIHYPIEHTLR
ncbi:tight junction protein ZO-3 isoform X3 [Bemisia tabaci]|uniref:tight junction protein ZO-3 isoform X3 n=1 Tax=Bemisia tabaci TaxID=7038 RepID=UPI003B284165